MKLADTAISALFNISEISKTPKESITNENTYLKHKRALATQTRSTDKNLLIFGMYTKLIQVIGCVLNDFSLSAIYASQVSPLGSSYSWQIKDNIFLNTYMGTHTYGVSSKI